MKKFKLIKEYPGSPELNTIIEAKKIIDVEEGKTKYFYNHTVEGEGAWIGSIEEKDFEYWEPIIDQNRLYHFIVENENGVKQPRTCFGEITASIGASGYKIFSVADFKKYFAIGMIVNPINRTGSRTKIKEITVANGEIFIKTGEGIFLWDKLEKSKAVFISKDGREMFEGDEVYKLEDNEIVKWKVGLSHEWAKLTPSDNYFYSKNGARDFMLRNNKLLSATEVNRVLGLSTTSWTKLFDYVEKTY